LGGVALSGAMISEFFSMPILWQGPFHGPQVDSIGSDLDLKKKTPGVYLWRRIQRLDPDALGESSSFKAWIARGVNSPLLKTEGLTLRSDESRLSVRASYLRSAEFSIGGGSLGELKKEGLLTLSDDARLEMYNNLTAATLSFGPVMYVGETDCLLSRLSQHAAPGSPLRIRLQSLGLDIEDVAVFFGVSPDFQSKHRRTLYESVLTHVLGAPLTFRAG
jgi:hypothetical protein